jgi:phospholipase/carboxylesterase
VLLRPLLAIALVALLAAIPVVSVSNPASGLRTLEAGEGKQVAVWVHGYAAAPADWVPFVDTIRLPGGYRFVFPEGPESTTPPDGPVGGRAWWRLGLSDYRASPSAPADLSRAHPAGLVDAAGRVRRLLAEVRTRTGGDSRRMILGGFSQGAMISAEVAFESDERLRALVLLSDTPVDEARLTASLPKRRGLPVFISHGRRDDILPFAAADRLQQTLRQAGLRVTWYPFEGGHEIPADVVTALNQFLATLP